MRLSPIYLLFLPLCGIITYFVAQSQLDNQFEILSNGRTNINCSDYISSIIADTSVLLLDINLLNDINMDHCNYSYDNLLLAVDVNNYKPQQSQNYSGRIVLYENSSQVDYLKIFDDPIRIIPKISFVPHGNILIPSDIPLFLQFWNRSKYIECIGFDMNRTSTFPNIEQAINALSHLRRYLLNYQMFSFLNGGTLLGWYRECTIIPHTLDLDIAVFIEEYKPELLEDLKSKKGPFRINRKLGKPSDNFEFTVRNRISKTPIDIFFMYHNENTSWVGGTDGNGIKYHYSYPLYDPYCACDLKGRLFWITCRPEMMMTVEYGPEWYKDHPTSKFLWSGSHFNVKKHGKFETEELKKIKVYY